MNTREFMFEFTITGAYIENKSFFVYKEYTEKYAFLFPPLDVITRNNRKRTKSFLLINNGKKLKVFMDFQGHVRQSDRYCLHEWYEENQPKEGDKLLWYKTDKPYEFLIEMKKSHEPFSPLMKPVESENDLLHQHNIEEQKVTDKDKISKIIKFYELKDKGIITSDEFQKCKDELLSGIKTTLNNIENINDLLKKGLISDIDFNKKKKELLSNYSDMENRCD